MTRFTADAAKAMQKAIEKAGGIEVFAIGRLNSDKLVDQIEVHCRGNTHAVPALLSRPRVGEVVIHNHPNGVLQASQADMMLANLYGEDGVGVVIVNNAVDKALWVVEPYCKENKPVDLDEVKHIFLERLPSAMPGYEARTGQIDMSLKIAQAMNDGDIAVLEAGTGTGKSLAYLVPSILWATQNDSKVVVATYTITLQGQLVTADIPILERIGLKFRHALIKGRNNYLCRRRLGIALKVPSAADNQSLQSVAQFAETSNSGARSDMGFFVDEETWDAVGSDYEQTLRAKCPHFEQCFFYNARREAAKAHILIANHHLLLSDLLLKSQTNGEGCMPNYNRVILDEGHHLEDAATSLFQQQLSTRAVRRALSPLMKKKKKETSSLDKISQQHIHNNNSALDRFLRQRAQKIIDPLSLRVNEVWSAAEDWFQQIAHDALSEESPQRRIKPKDQFEPFWALNLEPTIRSAAQQLGALSDDLLRLEDILENLPEKAFQQDPQPLLDLKRSRRRLANQSAFLGDYLNLGDTESSIIDNPTVRWIEPPRKKTSPPSAVLKLAPIEVGPTLREKVFMQLKSVTACSATMTVDQSFQHFANRVGIDNILLPYTSGIFPSPFDYSQQAILALPNDIPFPTHVDFINRCARMIIESIRICNGGVFVLCTSYGMLRKLHGVVSQTLGRQYRVFRQGEMGRMQLLEAFLNAPNGILFGADSFWEGVSIKGDQLRMVIIPRLPFRVPSAPVEQARHEHMQASGKNPFREYSLPQACLRFRQGFGRLIRTQTDKGAVVVMDSRINSMWYGRTFIQSLPPVRIVHGNSTTVLSSMGHFFNQAGAEKKASPLGDPSASF